MPAKTEYTACMKRGLSGKSFTPEQRKKEFCITSKVCSKGVLRKDAEDMCIEAARHPHPPRPRKSSSREPASCPTTHKLLLKCEKTVQEMVNSGRLPHSINPKNFCYLVTY